MLGAVKYSNLFSSNQQKLSLSNNNIFLLTAISILKQSIPLENMISCSLKGRHQIFPVGLGWPLLSQKIGFKEKSVKQKSE